MIENIKAESPLVNDKLKSELSGIFAKLTEDMILKSVVDMNDAKGKEMAEFLAAVAALNEKIHLEVYDASEGTEVPELDQTYLPAVAMYKDGRYCGVAFHGVPGGQEINSFVLAIYNLAGPGQEISRWTLKKIQKLDKKTNIKICVSLACHHCPKMVAACQRIASLNENIEAEMIDATLYKDLVERYKIERVPVVIVNDEDVYVGQKDMEEVLRLIKK